MITPLVVKITLAITIQPHHHNIIHGIAEAIQHYLKVNDISHTEIEIDTNYSQQYTYMGSNS